MNSAAVLCKGLSKQFEESDGFVLKDLNLAVPKGTILSLLGPSGSGKTTALRLIAGFEVPDGGVVEVGGRQVAGPGLFVPAEQRNLGMVFQGYALFPHLSVAKNVGFGVRDRTAREERTSHTLALMGLADFGDRMPHELSGGQQQRVALARALASQPEVLLLDEPFSNLDAALRIQMREEVRDILKFTKTTAIFVTHDQDEALYLGDLVAVLDKGELQQSASPHEIYASPATRFVAEFLGSANFLPATYAAGKLETPVGNIPWDGNRPPDGSELLLRPDDMSIAPCSTGQGVVIGQVYQGPTFLYEVLLDTPQIIRVQQPHTFNCQGGTRVAVRIVAEHDLTVFAGDRRAE